MIGQPKLRIVTSRYPKLAGCPVALSTAAQVGLGWWFGYLSVLAVTNTELNPHVQIVPMAMADGPGMGLALRY